ncbi:MAG: peptidoglycan-binding protein [Eubacteriales bacterium]
MAYKEISKEEALAYLDFSSANSKWKTLYQCSSEEAKQKNIDCLDERIIKRLGALAKDYGKKIAISMGFRPSSYQEMLIERNLGVWSPSKCKIGNDLVSNLKGWVSGNFSVCAAPGTSNHNSGAAVDLGSSWAISLGNSKLEPYGLIKNVDNEDWHVVLMELKDLKKYDRVKYAIENGFEPVLAPCRDTYVSGRYVRRGANVALVQKRLYELSFFNGTVDGVFGDITKSAVKAFQSSAGLTVDGIVGAKTIASLINSSVVKEEFIISRLLKLSSPMLKGEDVKWLQNKLNKNGAGLTLDGIFGKKTKVAVKTFQKSAGLTADGIAGKNTVTALGGRFLS